MVAEELREEVAPTVKSVRGNRRKVNESGRGGEQGCVRTRTRRHVRREDAEARLGMMQRRKVVGQIFGLRIDGREDKHAGKHEQRALYIVACRRDGQIAPQMAGARPRTKAIGAKPYIDFMMLALPLAKDHLCPSRMATTKGGNTTLIYGDAERPRMPALNIRLVRKVLIAPPHPACHRFLQSGRR